MAAPGCEAGLISTVNTAEDGAAAAAADSDGARLSLCSEGKPGRGESNELFCFFVKLKPLSRVQCQEWGLEEGRRAACLCLGLEKKEKKRKETSPEEEICENYEFQPQRGFSLSKHTEKGGSGSEKAAKAGSVSVLKAPMFQKFT